MTNSLPLFVACIENLMSGLLPERQYKQLMKQYDDEQAELENENGNDENRTCRRKSKFR